MSIQNLNLKAMNKELRNKIIASNEAVKKLIDNGYSIQGIDKYNNVAVEKNGEIFTYDNYMNASNDLN